MTQMTQSFKASTCTGASFLGHLGHQKTMTQMTQSMPAGGHAGANLKPWPKWPKWPKACGPAAPGHKAKIAEGEGVGPSAKGQQKRSVHEQFFFLQNFYFLL